MSLEYVYIFRTRSIRSLYENKIGRFVAINRCGGFIDGRTQYDYG